MHHDKEIIGYRHNAHAQTLQLYLNTEKPLFFTMLLITLFQMFAYKTLSSSYTTNLLPSLTMQKWTTTLI